MIKSLLILCTIFTAKADVLKLTQDTFQDTLDSSEYVLVKFFAPWCGHCKKLAPEYEKLSNEVSDNVVIAEVDATEEKDLGSEYDVKGYPTLKWFVKGKEEEYSGGRSLDSMLQFINTATGNWATELDNEDALNLFTELQENSCVVVSNRDDTKAISGDFKSVRTGVLVGETTELLPPNTVRVYENFNGKLEQHELSDGTVEESLEFVSKHILPNIIDMSSSHFATSFDVSKLHIVLISDPNEKQSLVQELENLSKDISPKYLTVITTSENKKIMDLFSVEMLPSAFLIQATEFKKYSLGEVSEENIRKGIQQYETGELKETLKSEPEPESQEVGKPYVLVGTTFSETVKRKDAFVKFYAPWCGHCKKLAPVWDELAASMVDKDVLIAKYDATANENAEVKVQGFPTLRYYKNGEAIDYQGGRDLESLTKFVEQHASSTSPGGHTDL